MTSRVVVVAAALCLLGHVPGCKGSSDSGQPPLGLVSITVSPGTVFANGANTVAVHVSTTGSGPISVSTNKGTFAGGVTTTSVAG